MKKFKQINGVKSVDFKINAEGYGVVNWNGNMSVYSHDDNKAIDNHLVPKMKHLDIFHKPSYEANDGSKIRYTRRFDDDAFDKARVYVSQNCIRHHLFKDVSIGVNQVTTANVQEVLCSLIGLVRGYVIAEKSISLKRKSPLMLEDFITDFDGAPDGNGKVIYEQFVSSGSKNNTSIFSKHVVKEVVYQAYGSINIEELSFLPLENSLDRSCYHQVISEEEGKKLAEAMTEYLKNYTFLPKYKGLKPAAVFNTNYVRVNSLSYLNHENKQGKKTGYIGEAGILLNNDAISIVVDLILDMFASLYINQGGGWLKVNSMMVDYNDGQPMRIKSDNTGTEYTGNLDHKYAVYYEHLDMDK